jgi:beta-N-acetylglucosaminidase
MEKAMLEADKGNYEAARRYAEANGYFFSTNKNYMKTSPELRKMDSVNRFYWEDLSRAGGMSTDSVKRMQKGKREMNYQIRNKKQ